MAKVTGKIIVGKKPGKQSQTVYRGRGIKIAKGDSPPTGEYSIVSYFLKNSGDQPIDLLARNGQLIIDRSKAIVEEALKKFREDSQ